jgi:isopenicillin N synthase-like dioxygenase
MVNGRNDRERRRRQSIAFFHNPNGDAKIETIASCRDEEGGSRYQPVVFRDFLNELHHGSQTNYEREGGEQGNCEADEAG